MSEVLDLPIAEQAAQVARGEISAGVLLPTNLGTSESRSQPITVTIYAEQVNSTQQAAATAVSSVILSQGALVQSAKSSRSSICSASVDAIISGSLASGYNSSANSSISK